MNKTKRYARGVYWLVGLADMDSVTVVVDNIPPAPGSAEVNLRAEVVSTATAELTIQARTGKV